jgi:hypothetical protein
MNFVFGCPFHGCGRVSGTNLIAAEMWRFASSSVEVPKRENREFKTMFN